MRDGRIREDEVLALARMAGVSIEAAHLPGVMLNLDTLGRQAAVLIVAPLAPTVEPAPVFKP